MGAQCHLSLNRKLILRTGWITFMIHVNFLLKVGAVSHQQPLSWWQDFLNISLHGNYCLTKEKKYIFLSATYDTY